jgi:ABC-2 type transport system ATP-binding protein
VAPIDYVVHDRVAHDGRQHANDPRVGMIGGSYGGQIQFAVAGIDPRLDTIIPIITWNDLSYSLAPNNTNKVHGVTYGVRGTEKVEWTSLFFGLGIVDGLQGAQTDPKRNLGCPNFDNRVCRSKVQMDATGFPSDQTLAMARHASVESFLWRIKIPVLLAQGENDTLFNLNEAAATYLGLKMYHVPVSMIWQSWGHSGGPSSPGEYSGGADALSTYEGQRFFAWFNHYLKGSKASTGPNFSYFRDWVPFTGSGPDTVQYATAPSYPVGSQQSLYLSGTNALVSKATAVVTGASSFVAPAQSPSSYSETSALQGSTISDSDTPPRDAPGTFAAWTSDALTTSLKVAGIPTVTLHVRAPTATVTQAAYAAGRVLLFVKLYDVAPDGTVTLVHRLVSPARVLDVRQPVTITLPGIVHQFAAGHRLQLVVAGSDAAYRNNTGPVAVSIPTSASSPSILTLPVVRR